MATEPTLISVGDIIHVRMTVTNTMNHVSMVDAKDSEGDRFTACVGDIVHVEPRALAVGDKVRDQDDDYGTISAICRDVAWVDYGCFGMDTVALVSLERA